MAKFIQVCASQNDLFALDDDGNVFRYDFNAKTWVKLLASRAHEGMDMDQTKRPEPRREADRRRRL